MHQWINIAKIGQYSASILFIFFIFMDVSCSQLSKSKIDILLFQCPSIFFFIYFFCTVYTKKNHNMSVINCFKLFGLSGSPKILLKTTKKRWFLQLLEHSRFLYLIDIFEVFLWCSGGFIFRQWEVNLSFVKWEKGDLKGDGKGGTCTSVIGTFSKGSVFYLSICESWRSGNWFL